MTLMMVWPTIARGDDLLGAASSRHLWVVLEPRTQGETFELVHHPWDEKEWRFRAQHTMTQPPAKVAAFDDQVWLLMPPRQTAGGWQREVYSARVSLNTATGLYYTTPAGRLEMCAPLPGLGRLAGFTATAKGPVALLLPLPRAGASAAAAAVAGDAAGQPPLDRPVLLRLDASKSQWMEMALPAGFTGARMAAIGSSDSGLVILEGQPDNAARTVAHFLRGEGRWESSSFALDVRNVRGLISVAGQVVAATSARDSQNIDLGYVRPGGLLALATLPMPAGKWLATGFDDRIVVVTKDRGGLGSGAVGGSSATGAAAATGKTGGADPRLLVRTVDPLTGLVSSEVPFVRQPITAGRLWQVTLGLGLSLSAVLAVVLLRPPPASSVTVEASRLLPLGHRALALAIDAVPGVAAAMLILDCLPADLMLMPMATFDFERTGPFIVAAAVMSLVATASELAFDRSLGKTIVGGRIVSIAGASPARWRILLRGVLRLLVLLIPPLAVFAWTNSHMQGIPDMAARTLVVRNAAPTAEVDQPKAE